MPPEAWLQDFGAALQGEADAQAQARLLAHWGSQEALSAALADVRWLSAQLRALPKPAVPDRLASQLQVALAEVQLLPGLDADGRLGVAPYLLGHDPDDLEPGEAERLAHAFADEEASGLALGQLDALELALNDLPPPPPMPANLLSRIRLALDEESVASPSFEATHPERRWALGDGDEAEAPIPSWALPALAALDGGGTEALGPEEGRVLGQLSFLQQALREAPKPVLPVDLATRLHAALVDEAGQSSSAGLQGPALLAKAPVVWFRRPWATGMAGAMAAALAVFFLAPPRPSELPRIETAAVEARTDVAVNIGFDVERDLEGVTFQIDLPEGLKFLDDKRQPLLAQSVSWRGSLKAGRTVVPIHVQGVRPGRYEIEAFVRKGQMMRKTTIVLPVKAAQEG